MTSKMVEKSDKADLIKAFRICDDDDSGKLTLSKLKRAAQILGEDITDEEIQVSRCLKNTHCFNPRNMSDLVNCEGSRPLGYINRLISLGSRPTAKLPFQS